MPYLCDMAGSSEILTHTPYIALVLCYALGSAIYIGLAQWTRAIAHGNYNQKTPFQTITPWLKAAFVTVLLASLVRQTIYLQSNSSEYIAEIIVLAFIMLAFTLKQKYLHKNAAPEICAHALTFLKLTGLYCLFTSLLWAVLMGFFLLTLLLVQSVNYLLPLAIDGLQVSVMATALLALSPLYIWYKKSKDRAAQDRLQTPDHYKFHHILWPFIVGLFLFILPLFIEKVAASDKFHDMMNAKPALQRV